MYSRSQNDEKKIFVSPCCTHREAAAAVPPLTALPLPALNSPVQALRDRAQ